MGKRIIPRARGAGSQRYRSPSHRFFGRVEFAPVTGIVGRVKDIVDDPGRSAPLAIIRLENGKEILHIALEGMRVGDPISYNGDPNLGNVLTLSNIPVGTRISSIETWPGSGPKLCRSSGSYATVVGRTGNRITVEFGSGKGKFMNENCRAAIGIPAGGGRREKPFVKAGRKHFAFMARGRLYPRASGVAMSPVDHPYGGKSKRPKGKSVKHSTPPGAKVGSIAPRRMGIRKGR